MDRSVIGIVCGELFKRPHRVAQLAGRRLRKDLVPGGTPLARE